MDHEAEAQFYWGKRLALLSDEAAEQKRKITQKKTEHRKRGKGEFRLGKKDREDQISIDEIATVYRSFVKATKKELQAADKLILRSYAAKFRGLVVG
ncbi:hypothetical protein GOC23_23780 [Sinorhizobium meliloti]|nr:hypothetical protein [Sinorhizobium meliloti]